MSRDPEMEEVARRQEAVKGVIVGDELLLPKGAPMAAYQAYIEELERRKGWLSVDLVHNCFLMGEEVGELFKAVRRQLKYFEENSAAEGEAQRDPQRNAEVAEELVDVFNYLCAIANRLEIDLESAFRQKNKVNQGRQWT